MISEDTASGQKAGGASGAAGAGVVSLVCVYEVCFVRTSPGIKVSHYRVRMLSRGEYRSAEETGNKVNLTLKLLR